MNRLSRIQRGIFSAATSNRGAAMISGEKLVTGARLKNCEHLGAAGASRSFQASCEEPLV